MLWNERNSRIRLNRQYSRRGGYFRNLQKDRRYVINTPSLVRSRHKDIALLEACTVLETVVFD